MFTADRIMKAMRRTAATLILATAYLASGYSAEAATNARAYGEGIVLVPPAKPVKPAPEFKRGKIVAFSGRHAPGSIVIVTAKKQLYYVLGNGRAVQYKVATAKPGFEWSGTHKVSAKTKWPDWRPPETMRKRRPDLPAFMKGGPNNPLGARAIYLGSSIYRIHGTNEPASIGKSASSGCIRMLNADVTELYAHVKMGAAVIVM